MTQQQEKGPNRLAVTFTEDEYWAIHNTALTVGFAEAQELRFTTFVLRGLGYLAGMAISHADSLKEMGDLSPERLQSNPMSLLRLEEVDFDLQLKPHETNKEQTIDYISKMRGLRRRIVPFRLNGLGMETAGIVSMFSGRTFNDVMRAAGYEAVTAARADEHWEESRTDYEAKQRRLAEDSRARLIRSLGLTDV